MSSTAKDIHPIPNRAPPATKYIELHGDYGTTDFIMRRGESLPQVTVAYESWGELSSANDNAVLVFTGLSPSAHACSSVEDPDPGWWEYMIGPGKPIDTNRFYVVCVNSLGSCFGSTCANSINPKTGESYSADFPELTIEDIAKAGHHAMQELGVEHLCAVVGASMGGMSSLAYALQYPDEVDYLVTISGACRSMPLAIAMRSLQREIVRCDPDWKNGRYELDEEPKNGMVLARKLGLVSYRAAEEWNERFNRARVDPSRRSKNKFGVEFEVESYLDYNAHKFVENFDANSYLYLSRAMDLFDVAEHGGSVNAGLAKIHAKKTLVVGVDTDILFPVQQQEEIYNGIKNAGRNVQFEHIESNKGHDAFLIDEELFSPVLRKFFAEIA